MMAPKDVLGTDGEVSQNVVAPEAPASEGWCGTPPLNVSLGAVVVG